MKIIQWFKFLVFRLSRIKIFLNDLNYVFGHTINIFENVTNCIVFFLFLGISFWIVVCICQGRNTLITTSARCHYTKFLLYRIGHPKGWNVIISFCFFLTYCHDQLTVTTTFLGFQIINQIDWIRRWRLNDGLIFCNIFLFGYVLRIKERTLSIPTYRTDMIQWKPHLKIVYKKNSILLTIVIVVSSLIVAVLFFFYLIKLLPYKFLLGSELFFLILLLFSCCGVQS